MRRCAGSARLLFAVAALFAAAAQAQGHGSMLGEGPRARASAHCDKPHAMVEIEQAPDDTSRKLEFVGLPPSMTDAVAQAVKRSNCYALGNRAPLKLMAAVMSVWNVPRTGTGAPGAGSPAAASIISFDVYLSLVQGTPVAETYGYGIAHVRQFVGPPVRIEVTDSEGTAAGTSLRSAYEIALAAALDDALSTLAALY